MKAHLAGCLIVTMTVLGFLAHAVFSNPKPPPPLRLIVSPHIAFAPSDVIVTVRLSPDASDRLLRVQIDSGEFYRSSDWTIDGAESPKVYRVAWKDIPDGEYEVRAQVGNALGVRATATDRVL